MATVVVFGGTGFLGRRLVEHLTTEGATVRVAVRDPDRARIILDAAGLHEITVFGADVCDQASVAAALARADAVVNAVSAYVEKRGAQAVVRGLRAVSDFEFEFQMALMNRRLNERIETIFMMPKDTYTFLSSRIVKEIARFGGDVSPFVPAHVRAALAAKLKGAPA